MNLRLLIVGLVLSLLSAQQVKSALLVLLLVGLDNAPNAEIGTGISDGPSLNDKVLEWSKAPLQPQREINVTAYEEGSCENAEGRTRIIADSIERALNFYEAQWQDLTQIDSTIGLGVIKGNLAHVLKKRAPSKYTDLAKRIGPLMRNIAGKIVNDTSDKTEQERLREFISRSKAGHGKGQLFDWKSPSALKTSPAAKIGDDKEVIWGVLNQECQFALVNNCDVPYICQRSFLDKEPQSQYMLTHQALYLMFARRQECELKHPELFGDLQQRLETQCSKMFLEASFISQHDYPEWGRDLFNEYVFLCGQVGYSNFLREDWIDAVLSWQSKSSVGCFVNPELERKNYATTDKGIVRAFGEGEMETTEKEMCLPHLTTTALSALAVQLRWYFDKCLPYNEEFGVLQSSV